MKFGSILCIIAFAYYAQANPAIGDVVSGATGAIGDGIAAAGTAAGDAIDKGTGAIASGVGSVGTEVIATAGNTKDKIVGGVNSGADVGSQITKAVGQALGSAVGALVGGLSSVLEVGLLGPLRSVGSSIIAFIRGNGILGPILIALESLFAILNEVVGWLGGVVNGLTQHIPSSQ